MLDIEILNNKVVELDERVNEKADELNEQDNVLLNKINTLFMEMYSLHSNIRSLKAIIEDQNCTINNQNDSIRKLNGENFEPKLYRVLWENGGIEMVFADTMMDAHDKAMQGYKGKNKIINIFINTSDKW